MTNQAHINIRVNCRLLCIINYFEAHNKCCIFFEKHPVSTRPKERVLVILLVLKKTRKESFFFARITRSRIFENHLLTALQGLRKVFQQPYFLNRLWFKETVKTGTDSKSYYVTKEQ